MSSEVSTKKRSSGRPKANIDWDKVAHWVTGGANATQVAASLGIDRDTLYIRCKTDLNMDYSAFSQQKKELGDRLIHNAQFEVAIKNKNTSMLIWLGKQRLGQRDKDEEVQVTPETMAAFQSFMDMLNKAQSAALNKEDTSNNTESKS